MRETIIDHEHFTLWLHRDTKIVHHMLKRYITGPAVREVLMRGLELFEQYGCEKWLSDDREASTMNAGDKVWADFNWEPRIIAAGWKYWAIVLPEKTSGQLDSRELIRQYSERGVTARVFVDVDEAYAWLASQ